MQLLEQAQDGVLLSVSTPEDDIHAAAAANDSLILEFEAFRDGRGFSLARRLRDIGYKGRLRAVGKLIADQYAMARRVGFDEVQITAELAKRQPQEQWLFRADWQAWDHRAKLAG